MPYASNGEIKIHYEVEGDGPPLVLIHGYLGSISTWKMTGYIREFSKHFKVIAIDTRGYGKSSKPYQTEAYGLEQKVEDVAAVLDQEGIDTANMLGFSGGGRIVFAAAKHMPKRITKAVVGGMSPFLIPEAFDMQERTRSLEKGIGAVVENFELMYGELPERMKRFLMQNDSRAILADTLATIDFDGFAGDLMYFDVPFLLYVGSMDPFYRDVIRASKVIPNCTLKTFDGLDHYQTLTSYRKVVPLVEDFLLS